MTYIFILFLSHKQIFILHGFGNGTLVDTTAVVKFSRYFVKQRIIIVYFSLFYNHNLSFIICLSITSACGLDLCQMTTYLTTSNYVVECYGHGLNIIYYRQMQNYIGNKRWITI